MRVVAARGLVFDLQAFPDAMQAAADLATEIPEQSFAMLHAGFPVDRSEEGLAMWHTGMKALAKCPNMSVKMSGLPMTDRQWTVASLREFTAPIFQDFGPDRMMFGSNFPVDSLFSSYPTLVAGYVAALHDASPSDIDAIFRKTAQRVYKLPKNAT
jgi:predicted TIM-barrel fold metal-dependent hydrolase